MFKDTFCPSPWLHMRINNSGHYKYCRWASNKNETVSPNIQHEEPLHFFKNGMASVRKSMLEGDRLPGCSECYEQEQHGKVSGRQRQLLKIGVRFDDFVPTMLSSPWINEFKHTQEAGGITKQTPQDWQIDLGNYCNSSCIFCEPASSSKLATEFYRIGLVNEIPRASWCEDPVKFDRFILALKQSKIKYIHFIGGETLITPAFNRVLKTLIKENLHKTITIGFTTNLTVWDQDTVDLLTNFKQINLGMSIECIHPLNDYVRYGSKIEEAIKIMEQWLAVAKQQNWLVQLRITPTIFTIWHLVTVYEYAFRRKVAVESCNFLNNPEFLKSSVLPMVMRKQVIDQLETWINKNKESTLSDQVVNTRHPDFAEQQILEDAQSYVNYLKDQPDESFRLPALVDYIKLLESSRGNSILDYLPEYEELLRSAGY
jgi:organic radical activating enzyme